MERLACLTEFDGQYFKDLPRSVQRRLSEMSDHVVEFGVLIYPERPGARNPSKEWRHAFLKQEGIYRAAHLCGINVFGDVLHSVRETIDELMQYDRIQVNINARRPTFTDSAVIDVFSALNAYYMRPIFQYYADTAHLLPHLGHPDVLFDESRGKGIAPTAWKTPLTDYACGYAGGLGADFRHFDDVLRVANDRSWVDMETNIRTDNRFDCRKVELVIRYFNDKD